VRRWVIQYSFYINDRDFGPMFVRMCPYFPFPARVCLNQHHWLAERLRRKGVKFRQSDNCFSTCADPAVLQQLADSFSAGHLIGRATKWLNDLTPFFTPEERKEHNCFHRLYFSQVEYCDNLIFRRRAGDCPVDRRKVATLKLGVLIGSERFSLPRKGESRYEETIPD
jgi:hypothetical protein